MAETDKQHAIAEPKSPQRRLSDMLFGISSAPGQLAVNSILDKTNWVRRKEQSESPRYAGGDAYVAIGDPHSKLTPKQEELAWDRVLALDDRLAQTFLIAFSRCLAEDDGAGQTRIHVNDILEFRGIKKQTNGGFDVRQKREVQNDLVTLSRFYIAGKDVVIEGTGKRRKQKMVRLYSQLIVVAIEMEDEPSDEAPFTLLPQIVDDGMEIPYAFRIRPGEWAHHYLGKSRETAVILGKIVRYDPRQGVQRMAMRLGLYLAIQWRIRAYRGNYGQTWQVGTLLKGAKVEMPDRNLNRFRDKFEAALDRLCTDDVIPAWEYDRGDEAALTGRNRYDRWLRWTVRITPSPEVLEHYSERFPATAKFARTMKKISPAHLPE